MGAQIPVKLPLSLPWDWPRWTLRSVARTARELPGLSLTALSGSACPWERQEGSRTLHMCVHAWEPGVGTGVCVCSSACAAAVSPAPLLPWKSSW